MTNGDIEIFRHIFEIGTDEDKGGLILESFSILQKMYQIPNVAQCAEAGCY